MADDKFDLATARGAASFDYNGASVFVRADVDAVSAALAKHRSAAGCETDIAGKEVELAKQCFFVFRFAGHQWTQIIGRDSYTDSANPFMAGSFDPETLKAQMATHLNESDAAKISEAWVPPPLYYAISDTAAALNYTLFEKGQQIEHLEEGETYDEEGDSEDVLKFSSTSGKAGPKDSGEVYDWVENLFKQLDCFEPGVAFTHFVGYVMHKPGEKVTINNDKDELERLDFVTL